MPITQFELKDDLSYLKGLNNYHETEVAPGIIPKGTTYEQIGKYGVYPERLSGTSFTTLRSESKQAFLYRLLPSTLHTPYEKAQDYPLNLQGYDMRPVNTTYAPIKIVEAHDFVTGLRIVGGAGEPSLKSGAVIYSYTAGKDMPEHQAFDSADGDLCIIPQQGTLDIRTELGRLRVRPAELVVIPRGIRFHVSLPQGPVRGFAFETYSGHYDLPELGPIGTYCLANARDFEIPVASVVDSDAETELLTKYCGVVHRATYRGSIFNVAAWHGTYYPFKYDLAKFAPIGSLLVDHPDPSTFTVLTCPSEKPAHPAADICLIGPRWVVMENSFRPARYHRNTMTEFFFILKGGVDNTPVSPETGGLFGHNSTMTPHGAGRKAYEKALEEAIKPERIGDGNMVILFETCYMTGVTEWVENNATKLLTPQEDIDGFKKAQLPI